MKIVLFMRTMKKVKVFFEVKKETARSIRNNINSRKERT